ncbi:MAG: hypothetical protein PHE09_08810 [Oscillospiraceae bacterium]|nr:hypothetical protein [Oscillospiraceae bacterium]
MFRIKLRHILEGIKRQIFGRQPAAQSRHIGGALLHHLFKRLLAACFISPFQCAAGDAFLNVHLEHLTALGNQCGRFHGNSIAKLFRTGLLGILL